MKMVPGNRKSIKNRVLIENVWNLPKIYKNLNICISAGWDYAGIIQKYVPRRMHLIHRAHRAESIKECQHRHEIHAPAFPAHFSLRVLTYIGRYFHVISVNFPLTSVMFRQFLSVNLCYLLSFFVNARFILRWYSCNWYVKFNSSTLFDTDKRAFFRNACPAQPNWLSQPNWLTN